MPSFYPMYICMRGPDPYSEFGSGSRKLQTTDPIWIRIHNYALDSKFRVNADTQILNFAI